MFRYSISMQSFKKIRDWHLGRFTCQSEVLGPQSCRSCISSERLEEGITVSSTVSSTAAALGWIYSTLCELTQFEDPSVVFQRRNSTVEVTSPFDGGGNMRCPFVSRTHRDVKALGLFETRPRIVIIIIQSTWLYEEKISNAVDITALYIWFESNDTVCMNDCGFRAKASLAEGRLST